jgi:hypothetical protein
MDGDLNDPYERMTITTTDGILFKREPSDVTAMAVADRVASLRFSYFDTNGDALVDAVDESGQIAYVEMDLVTTAAPDALPMTLTAGAGVRLRE